jgi:hypothetical protein
MLLTVRWGQFKPSQPSRRVAKVGPNQTVTTTPRRLTGGATSSRPPGAKSGCHSHEYRLLRALLVLTMMTSSTPTGRSAGQSTSFEQAECLRRFAFRRGWTMPIFAARREISAARTTRCTVNTRRMINPATMPSMSRSRSGAQVAIRVLSCDALCISAHRVVPLRPLDPFRCEGRAFGEARFIS